MSKDDENLKEDFQSFASSQTMPLSSERSIALLNKIKKLLKPNPFLVFAKVLIVVMAVGFLSLFICHQFGLNPFRTDKSLAEWFMGVGGHKLCMILCGLLFQSLGVLLAGVFITQEEIQVLRKNQLVQLPALGFVSLISFAIFGAQLVLQFAALWLFGAIIGGWLATRCIHSLKVAY